MDNAGRIAAIIQKLMDGQPAIHCLMLDMEDASLIDPTITLHTLFQDAGYPVALTLQAYLRRTYRDMENQIRRCSQVRLVKGAFAADAGIAHTAQSEIKQNYYRLIDLMFSRKARETGFYPIIATHDTNIHAHAIRTARENGWASGSYEFEMLMGVYGDAVKELANRGKLVRLYVPFSLDWWPHAARRIGEKPRNAMLLLRSSVR